MAQVRVTCKQLREAELQRVLVEPRDSVSKQLTRYFAGYGIEVALTECALREVARRAVAQRTGARGLLTVLEEALRDYKFELPGTGVAVLEVDAATVREPAAKLAQVLAAAPASPAV